MFVLKKIMQKKNYNGKFNPSIIAQVRNLLSGLRIFKTNIPAQHTQAHNAEKTNTQSSLKEI